MSSKKLEKQVHFTAEGTAIGCYDSKGSPVRYLMICGEPYISLDNSVNRFFSIEDAVAHNREVNFYANNRSDSFARVDLAGVVNATFITSKNSHWMYAERRCSHRELASFHLAKYRAHKNAIKLSEVKNEQ